jgi:hypothetical protein
MRILQLFKRYRVAVAVILVSYLLSYCLARYTQMLIHRVSHAGDVYYHSIDTGSRYTWSPIGFSVPISYIIFSPLRWIEALAWRFIPRHYEIH